MLFSRIAVFYFVSHFECNYTKRWDDTEMNDNNKMNGTTIFHRDFCLVCLLSMLLLRPALSRCAAEFIFIFRANDMADDVGFSVLHTPAFDASFALMYETNNVQQRHAHSQLSHERVTKLTFTRSSATILIAMRVRESERERESDGRWKMHRLFVRSEQMKEKNDLNMAWITMQCANCQFRKCSIVHDVDFHLIYVRTRTQHWCSSQNTFVVFPILSFSFSLLLQPAAPSSFDTHIGEEIHLHHSHATFWKRFFRLGRSVTNWFYMILVCSHSFRSLVNWFALLSFDLVGSTNVFRYFTDICQINEFPIPIKTTISSHQNH